MILLNRQLLSSFQIPPPPLSLSHANIFFCLQLPILANSLWNIMTLIYIISPFKRCKKLVINYIVRNTHKQIALHVFSCQLFSISVELNNSHNQPLILNWFSLLNCNATQSSQQSGKSIITEGLLNHLLHKPWPPCWQHTLFYSERVRLGLDVLVVLNRCCLIGNTVSYVAGLLDASSSVSLVWTCHPCGSGWNGEKNL